MDKLQVELNKEKPHIVIISEHGLREENLLQTHIEGYILGSYYCRKTHLWGGIAIYKEYNAPIQLDDIQLNEMSTPVECVYETIAVDIKLKKESITLLATYRSPNTKIADYLEKLTHSLQQLMKSKTNLLIIGDANFDISRPQEKSIIDLSNLLTEYGCYIYDIPETRTTSTTSSSIDGCYTNLKPLRLKVAAHKNIISDHHTLVCEFLEDIGKKDQLFRTHRQYTKRNLEHFKKLLQKSNWQQIYTLNNIDDKYNELLKILKLNLDHAIPKATRQVPNKKKTIFWNDEVTLKRRELHEALNKYEKSGTKQDKNFYQKTKIDYDHLIRAQRSTHTIERITQSENKNKEIWMTINEERRRTQHDNTTINLLQNGKSITDPVKITNILNDFFLNPIDDVTHSPAVNIINEEQQNTADALPCLTNFKIISTSELTKLFTHIKSNNAAGYDEITGKLLQHCKEEITKPLLHIINTSITENKIPLNLKISKIYPTFKKGDRQDPGNYRPISNLPTISKLLERIIYNQIINHLELNNLLTICQHGFRRKRGTNTAIAQLCEDIATIWEDKKNASGLFLDLQKAFDSLDWNILLQKLRKLNIRGNAIKWIENYLQHRYQYVELDHLSNNTIIKTQSSLKLTTKGIPQGSILGPLFFLIFINDLPERLFNGHRCILFADDTTIIIPTEKNKNNIQTITEAINNVTTVCNNLKLKLNTKKTTHIHFTPNNNHQNEDDWADLNVETEESTKFLGVIVDKNLTWQQHIDYLRKKLASAHYAIRRIRTITNEETSIIAYHSLFASHLRYGIAAWGSTAAANMEKILILQKNTLRTICRKHYLEHCKPLFVQLKILTVFSQYILETVILAKKSNPTPRSEFHNHNTRHKNNIDLPQHRLKKYSNTPTYTGSKFINLLPNKITNITNHDTFIRTLKQYLINRPYYSISEFIEEHTFTHLHYN